MKISTFNILILICITSCSQSGFSQAPAIVWEKCYGGLGDEQAFSIAKTIDGGYIFAGNTWSPNNGDVSGRLQSDSTQASVDDLWIGKIAGNGMLEWQKCLGGQRSESASSIIQTFDGGYVIAGFTRSKDGDVSGFHLGKDSGVYDAWIIKLDTSGNIIWQKCLGGSLLEEAHSVIQTKDSGYIIAAISESNDGDVSGNHQGGNDAWIIKLDHRGNILWQHCFGGSGDDEVNSIIQTSDNGFIFCGKTSTINDGEVSGHHIDGGEYDAWVVKLDSLGGIEWQKCLGGSDQDEADAIIQSYDGGYTIAGWTNSPNDGDVSGLHGIYADYWVVKLDSKGKILWQKCLGGSGEDFARAIIMDKDSGYVIAGATHSFDGDVTGSHETDLSNDIAWDYWIVKLKPSGDILWEKSLGGSHYDAAFSLVQSEDNGYVIAGYSNSNDGDVSGLHGGRSDVWVVKLREEKQFVSEAKVSSFYLYPNPATSLLTIRNAPENLVSISIMNVLGQSVLELASPHTPDFTIDISKLPPGMYYARILAGSSLEVRKIIKE